MKIKYGSFWKRRKPRLYGDPLTTGRQETSSERRSRRRVEARHRAGNFPESCLTLEDIVKDYEGEAIDRAERVARDLQLEGMKAAIAELRRQEQTDDGQCHGTTKAGTRCKKASRHGDGGRFCVIHAA